MLGLSKIYILKSTTELNRIFMVRQRILIDKGNRDRVGLNVVICATRNIHGEDFVYIPLLFSLTLDVLCVPTKVFTYQCKYVLENSTSSM